MQKNQRHGSNCKQFVRSVKSTACVHIHAYTYIYIHTHFLNPQLQQVIWIFLIRNKTSRSLVESSGLKKITSSFQVLHSRIPFPSRCFAASPLAVLLHSRLHSPKARKSASKFSCILIAVPKPKWIPNVSRKECKHVGSQTDPAHLRQLRSHVLPPLHIHRSFAHT